jgi:hypothetical protein
MSTQEVTATPQDAQLAALLANAHAKLYLKQNTPAEQETINRLLDTLPEPPTWFFPTWFLVGLPLIPDDFSPEEVKAEQALRVQRHLKWAYQEELKKAGAVESLESLKEQDGRRKWSWHLESCISQGIPWSGPDYPGYPG